MIENNLFERDKINYSTEITIKSFLNNENFLN